MITATFKIRGIAPYSQSRPHLEEQEPNEGHDDYRKRTWRAHLHVDVIPEWSGNAEIVVLDETVLQTSRTTANPVLQDIVEAAGQYIGLGRFRPRNNGHYGRFIVESFQVNK